MSCFLIFFFFTQTNVLKFDFYFCFTRCVTGAVDGTESELNCTIGCCPMRRIGKENG